MPTTLLSSNFFTEAKSSDVSFKINTTYSEPDDMLIDRLVTDAIFSYGQGGKKHQHKVTTDFDKAQLSSIWTLCALFDSFS